MDLLYARCAGLDVHPRSVTGQCDAHPPEQIQELRDLTRTRKQLTREITRHTQRIQKTLEDANVKLTEVISNVLGTSRAILRALIAGESEPHRLVELTGGRLKAPKEQLVDALHGRVTEHHRFMLKMHLEQVERLEEAVRELEARADQGPFRVATELLVTIPGVSDVTARVIVAEIGDDMSRFPSAGNLVSWAGLCPRLDESAGKRRSTRTRQGAPWLKTVLVQAARAAANKHPYVYGDWIHKPGLPTILLYGHHDVQPPGREARWRSPAFEPTERKGRLYGRGTADDKAGVMAHVAAVGAYLRAGGELPCNVKFVIEGEEEIGSENLGRFLDQYKQMMVAAFIVLSDTANFDTGVPALTYQLRGIVQVDVEVQCLDHPLHSGMWGGPVPDPVQILCGLIASLQGKKGALDIPGLYKDVTKPQKKQLKRIRSLPFDEKKFKKDGALVKGLSLWGEKGFTEYEKMWTRPSLTMIALEAHPIQGSSNQILDAARARLSLRTVPNMDARKAGLQLVKCLTKNSRGRGAKSFALSRARAPP